jgi:DNA polymerase (family 10)
MLVSGIQCDLRCHRGPISFALNYFTGSKEHNVRMRTRALEQSWSLNEYRFSKAEGRDQRTSSPDSVGGGLYRSLGLAYIEPELREDRENLAAEAGRLRNC